MEFDVFLYGRTRTYDYSDMYMPSWLTFDSEEYNDYRKIISHLFKIRDMLSENESEILKNTADSFYFYKTPNISMLCRCCHVVGTDEYGRTICSTEGFICRNESQKDLWFQIPDMIISMLSGQKTFYTQYMEKYSDDLKPPQVVRHEDINILINVMSETEISDDTARIIRNSSIEYQFKALVSAMSRHVIPFNFVIGQHPKKIYSYEHSKNVPDTQMYFTGDECTQISDDLLWKSIYNPLKINIKVSNYYVYLDMKKSSQGKIRYRLVAGNEPNPEKIITDTPFVGYEIESDQAVKISELNTMYEIMKDHLLDSGWNQSTENKYSFEKW